MTRARTVATGGARIPPFTDFLERHRTAVYGFLRATVGPNEADDCFQETFLSALRAYPRLRDGANLRGWILAIATRKAIDAGRARGRRPIPLGDVAEVAGPDGAETDHRREAVDPAEPLWRGVSGLPPRQRVAVVQRFVLDLSYADIAEAMGSTEETARANVHQGLKKLRKGWDDATD